MKDQLVKVVDGVVKLVDESETFWTPETIKPEVVKAVYPITVDAPIISYVSTILRKDRRFCTGMISCHLYDKEKEGQPCTVDIERCEYLKHCFGGELELTNEIERLQGDIRRLKRENDSLRINLDKVISEKDSNDGDYFKLKIRHNNLIAEIKSTSPEIASKYEGMEG